ncbi:MAG: VWA domain-containing protein [Alphaproteobacteria bacterium]
MDAQPLALVPKMVRFIDHLRDNDFSVDPAETEAALRLLADDHAPPLMRARQSLRILLACRKEEWERFDDLFEAYWFSRGRVRTRTSSTSSSATGQQHPDLWQDHLDGRDRRAQKPGVVQEAVDDDGDAAGEGEGRLIASRQTMIQRTDLRHLTDPAEIAEAERLAYRLASVLRYRLSRRYRQARRGPRLDLRRTLRANISSGGEPFDLVQKKRPDRPVRLVVLLDVSGSMQPYSRFFLQFVKGLVCRWLETEAFLFHTRLVRVTDAVRDRDSIRAMSKLALMAEGFGGGTRIGACLKLFNERYAKRTLNSRTVFLILSDGYDTGSCDDLVDQLERLKKRGRRLVWLNPLLGWRDYQPINQAMMSAMPLIDHFAAAHTLEALALIESDLARL